MEVPSLVVPWISEQKPDEAQGSAEFDSIWSERYFFVQWVPACSHSMQGQDSFLSKDMAETSSYSLLWHGSVKVTRAFISLLQLYKNQSLPLEQWHPRFLHALWKVYAASNRREKNWCIKWFFFKSLQELHPHGSYISCKCCNVFSMGTSIHAQGTQSEPLRFCGIKHQSLLQKLSRVRSGGLTSLKNSQLVRMSWKRSCLCDSFGNLVAVKVVSSWALEFCSCF